MPLKSFALLRFEDRSLLADSIVQTEPLPWLLRDHTGTPFQGWKGASRQGRDAWPATTFMALLLLRHGTSRMSRVGAVREAGVNAAWRAALRLPWTAFPPDEKTLRGFEAYLWQTHP